MFAVKFVNWERFLAVFWEHIILNFKRAEIRKWERFFEQSYIVKWVIFFAGFIDLEIFYSKFCNKKTSDDVHWKVWNKVVRSK